MPLIFSLDVLRTLIAHAILSNHHRPTITQRQTPSDWVVGAVPDANGLVREEDVKEELIEACLFLVKQGDDLYIISSGKTFDDDEPITAPALNLDDNTVRVIEAIVGPDTWFQSLPLSAFAKVLDNPAKAACKITVDTDGISIA